MGKNKEKLNIFLLHFLERLNSNEPNERKVIESLTDFCNYYGKGLSIRLTDSVISY